jgi:two-component system, NarL family, response regulator LiaR
MLMEKIRILIVDDHKILRDGLRMMIASEPGMQLIGEAADGEEGVQKARELKPDVILMDLVMPRKSGLEAIDEIIAENPEQKVLVLTSFADENKVFPAIKAGALGYLLKDSSPQQLVDAIRAVYRGESSLHPSIAIKLIRELRQPSNLPLADEPLSERELDVLRLVAKGLSNQDIADQLIVSEWTVRTHMRNILSKLHLANRTQAALYALREGWANIK